MAKPCSLPSLNDGKERFSGTRKALGLALVLLQLHTSGISIDHKSQCHLLYYLRCGILYAMVYIVFIDV